MCHCRKRTLFVVALILTHAALSETAQTAETTGELDVIVLDLHGRLNGRARCAADRALSHERCRIAGVDLPVRNILHHHASSRGDGAFTERDSRANHRVRAYPRAGFELNGLHDQSERAIAPVVVPGAKIRALRYAAVIGNRNGREVIDPAVLTQPGELTYRHKPRVLDPHPGFDHHA